MKSKTIDIYFNSDTRKTIEYIEYSVTDIVNGVKGVFSVKLWGMLFTSKYEFAKYVGELEKPEASEKYNISMFLN